MLLDIEDVIAYVLIEFIFLLINITLVKGELTCTRILVHDRLSLNELDVCKLLSLVDGYSLGRCLDGRMETA